MKIKTLYIADDDTQFDTQEECKEWERHSGLIAGLSAFCEDEEQVESIGKYLINTYHIARKNGKALSKSNNNG